MVCQLHLSDPQHKSRSTSSYCFPGYWPEDMYESKGTKSLCDLTSHHEFINETDDRIEADDLDEVKALVAQWRESPQLPGPSSSELRHVLVQAARLGRLSIIRGLASEGAEADTELALQILPSEQQQSLELSWNAGLISRYDACVLRSR